MCDNLHLLRIVVVKCFDLERLRELLGRWWVIKLKILIVLAGVKLWNIGK